MLRFQNLLSPLHSCSDLCFDPLWLPVAVASSWASLSAWLWPSATGISAAARQLTPPRWNHHPGPGRPMELEALDSLCSDRLAARGSPVGDWCSCNRSPIRRRALRPLLLLLRRCCCGNRRWVPPSGYAGWGSCHRGRWTSRHHYHLRDDSSRWQRPVTVQRVWGHGK